MSKDLIRGISKDLILKQPLVLVGGASNGTKNVRLCMHRGYDRYPGNDVHEVAHWYLQQPPGRYGVISASWPVYAIVEKT